MDYTIGYIKINENQEEFPLYSITISNEKDIPIPQINSRIKSYKETTFTKYIFKYYDNEELKEFSIKVTPAIHII